MVRYQSGFYDPPIRGDADSTTPLLSHPGPCDPGRVREALGYAPGCHDPYLGGPCGSIYQEHLKLIMHHWSILHKISHKYLSHPGPCDSGRVREAPGYAPGCHDPYLEGPCGPTWVGECIHLLRSAVGMPHGLRSDL